MVASLASRRWCAAWLGAALVAATSHSAIPTVVPADADPAVVKAAVARDGVVLIDAQDTATTKTDDEWASAAAALAKRLFGASLRVEPMVAAVHEEHAAVDDQKQLQNFTFTGGALLPHTDGYIYGDHQPDYVLLLVGAQSAVGGESVIVDGERVFGRVRPATLQRLETVDVDLTEHSPPGLTRGRFARGPVYRRLPRHKDTNDEQDELVVQGGHNDTTTCATTTTTRLWWRRQITEVAASQVAQRLQTGATPPPMADDDVSPYQSLWQPLGSAWGAADAEGVQEILEELDRAVQLEARVAPRFKVHTGQAVLVDNFRSLHGRERFEGDRRVWRVWVWTDASLGLPADVPQIATTVETQQILEGVSGASSSPSAEL